MLENKADYFGQAHRTLAGAAALRRANSYYANTNSNINAM
jgi:hypothetical protein